MCYPSLTVRIARWACMVDLHYIWVNDILDEVEKTVKREFFDKDVIFRDRDGNSKFSIQFIDDKGNRVFGSDSIDINILKAEQEEAISNLEMRNLKGTPYYVNFKPMPFTNWTVAVIQHRDLVFTQGILLALFIIPRASAALPSHWDSSPIRPRRWPRVTLTPHCPRSSITTRWLSFATRSAPCSSR